MTTDHPHVQALKTKHRALDDEIQAAERSPAVDDLEISEMKKRKLALKDEMNATA